MVDMAKRAGLPWDAILEAESRAYKPREAYLRSDPGTPRQCLMVAATRRIWPRRRWRSLRTAFVPRPLSSGRAQDHSPSRASRSTWWRRLHQAPRLGC
jgi:2-haloacid dehalogenase